MGTSNGLTLYLLSSYVSIIISPSSAFSGADPCLTTNLQPPQKSLSTSSHLNFNTSLSSSNSHVKLLHAFGGFPQTTDTSVPPPH